ncbi:hypothetical protein SAMN05442782_10890 [Streptomyces sp. OK228]|nr:hypothetical protein SAMN05442782_10890 [Streptomyces sp. OK228]
MGVPQVADADSAQHVADAFDQVDEAGRGDVPGSSPMSAARSTLKQSLSAAKVSVWRWI